MKTIVVSAVNIRKGGTLTILSECLAYLSTLAQSGEYRVVALVHDKKLLDCPGVELMEIPWTVGSWRKRLKCEYSTMRDISRQLAPVDLWLSLHDTTPNVEAKVQAVYCQTSFPFMKARWSDLKFDPKIFLFTLLTKFAYKVNVRRNKWLIVQTNWLRDGLSKMLGVDKSKFIVAPPKSPVLDTSTIAAPDKDGITTFFFPATADCHKNFETVCRAARLLEQQVGKGSFKVVLTIDGSENKYSAWLRKEFGDVDSIRFTGLLPKDKLYATYAATDCLLFPSRIETWGLPISEFAAFHRPMLLADLPYAHETSAGNDQVAFFNPDSPSDLAAKMRHVIDGDLSLFSPNPPISTPPPLVPSWPTLFSQLLTNADSTDI